MIKKMLESCKGAISVTGVAIDVVLVVALIPLITTFITNARDVYSCTGIIYDGVTATLNISECVNSTVAPSNSTAAINIGLSTTEAALLGLTTLLIVLAFIFMIVKQSGLTKKR